MSRKLAVFPNDPIKAYYVKGEIKSKYFNPCNLFDEVHVFSPCDEDVGEEKVKCIAGDAVLKIHPFGNFAKRMLEFFASQKTVPDLLKDTKFDIMRAYNPLLAGALAVSYAKKMNIPSVISVHSDYDYERTLYLFHRRMLREFIEKYCLSNATAVICVAKFIEEYAKRFGAKNTTTIYNRVYLGQFKPKKRKNSGRAFEILCVGRLDSQKDQETLIRAVKELDVTLTLVGRGDLEEKLRGLAKSLGIEKKVRFIGSVPNNKIHEYYQNADAFAISTNFEGFCIPVLEAMGCGLPVVANDCRPIPEILGGCGLIVGRNPEAFGTAFGELMSNPQLRNHLGCMARRRALTIDGKKMEEKECALYKKLLRTAT